MMPDRAIVKKALVESGGNLSRAAAILGCSRPTLYTWIYKLGLYKLAGVCLDRRVELDSRERKDTRPNTGIKTTVKPDAGKSPTLGDVEQVAVNDMPIQATIRVRESLWRNAKIAAIQEGITVAQYVERLLEVAQAPRRRTEAGSGDPR